MVKQLFVSIIIVNYNGKNFIQECIDSVLKSNYSKFEIIVLDNASTDGSYNLLKNVYCQNQKVRIFRSNKQLFFTGGCNFGAKHSRGQKLIFLNSDTIVDQYWIKELINFSDNNEKYLIQPKILAYPQKDIIDNAGGRYIFPGIGISMARGKKDAFQYNQPKKIDYASGTCFMIDKEFFEAIGGFDEWYKYHYEDVDLSLRAKKQDGQTWYCPKSIIFHKGSLSFKGNVRNQELAFNVRKNRLQTVIKNFEGPEKFIRLLGLLIIYLILALKELFSFNPGKTIITVNAIISGLTKS